MPACNCCNDRIKPASDRVFDPFYPLTFPVTAGPGSIVVMSRSAHMPLPVTCSVMCSRMWVSFSLLSSVTVFTCYAVHLLASDYPHQKWRHIRVFPSRQSDLAGGKDNGPLPPRDWESPPE